MNRRSFLKSFGALAAAAVTSPALLKLATHEIDALVAAMRGGVIEDRVFLFTAPITIDFPNLIIRRCKFIFRFGGFGGAHVGAAIILGPNARNFTLDTCHVDCGGAVAGIRVEQQEGDVTQTLQSALDVMAGGGKIELAPGEYQVGSPLKLP